MQNDNEFLPPYTYEFHPILRKICFTMRKGIVPSTSTVGIFTGNPIKDYYIRDITVEELEIKIHPCANFILKVTFDDRSADDIEDDDYLCKRIQSFDKNTTLLQFLQWITSDNCFGKFEGILGNGKVVWGT
jgi:hypothetical protein